MLRLGWEFIKDFFPELFILGMAFLILVLTGIVII